MPQEKDIKSKIKNLTWIYVFALALIGCALVSAFLIMKQTIASQKYDAKIINISGQQRTYSQRIALLSAQLIYPEKREWAKAALKDVSAKMQKAHIALTQGDTAMHIPGIRSKAIYNLYFTEPVSDSYGRPTSTDKLLRHYLHEVEELLEEPNDALTSENKLITHVINDYHYILLPYLDAIVDQYERESYERLKKLENLELGLLLGAMLMLVLEGVFIFRPMVKRIHDTTNELLIANENLKKSKHQDKMAALGQLSAGMVHEINNALQPATGLGGYILKELERTGSTKQHQYMELILNSVNHTQKIMRSVLDFTQSGNSKKDHLPAYDTVISAIEFAKTFIPTTMIFDEQIVQNKETRAQMLECDKTHLSQIFINLFKNSYYAMEEQGTISIRIGPSKMPNDESKPSICMNISDRGCGIENAIIDKVFDPFFSTKDPSEGNGLGLSVVHGIVQDHGGTITVDSMHKTGTSFKIHLPVI